MIFVTVGTTDFDALVKAADQIATDSNETTVIQIGHGLIEPRHARWFRFEPSLEPYYDQADLVITHGGMGTVTEVLRRGLPVIGVSNPDRFDRHQDQILRAFGEAGHLIWCRNLADLPAAVLLARRTQFVPYQLPPSTIHQVITAYLHKLEEKA
ncbi:MAG: PssE/Cps14G family polysaccharide biosynthesis glycosyltransferase [Chloroflexota bacterium]|nr:PssE/Cps14G family polysaccharide biosynthesis glycosyltransferase [Chloroflexota bacterium]